MKSNFRLKEEYKDRLDTYISEHNVTNGIKPKHIKEVLRTNIGFMNYSQRENKDYIELRNPLIVFIGDSVTAGCFEEIDISKMIVAQDLRDGYVDKFKNMLHDHFGLSVVNVINSGIAGDNMFGMYKRRYQDIFNYKPDLVVINGSLNWSTRNGNNSMFEYYLNLLVGELRHNNIETVLMTSNVCTNDKSHKERIEIIRDIAKEKKIALVDIYKIFTEAFKEDEYKELLCNGINHPAEYVHTIMAKALMQLFEG